MVASTLVIATWEHDQVFSGHFADTGLQVLVKCDGTKTREMEVMVRDVYQEKCTLISGARAATKVYPFPVSDDIISLDHQLSWE